MQWYCLGIIIIKAMGGGIGLHIDVWLHLTPMCKMTTPQGSRGHTTLVPPEHLFMALGWVFILLPMAENLYIH